MINLLYSKLNILKFIFNISIEIIKFILIKLQDNFMWFFVSKIISNKNLDDFSFLLNNLNNYCYNKLWFYVTGP